MASLLVFLIGVPTIFLTRFVFLATHPQYFANTIPTISKSSAFAPASYVFLAGTLVVAACIVMSWLLVFGLSRQRARELPRLGWRWRLHRGLTVAAAALGILAGTCLALLALISLETHDPAHILLSYAFFVTQLTAYLADTAAALLLNRALAARHGPAARHKLGGKPAVCLIVILLGFAFLFLFLTRDRGLYANEMVAQGIYVFTEYTLATLCFAYAALYFPELRRHYRAGLETSRGPSGRPAPGAPEPGSTAVTVRARRG